jgi:endonuclease/exonuclease/phosphatase family metal-dependent hydrolase
MNKTFCVVHLNVHQFYDRSFRIHNPKLIAQLLQQLSHRVNTPIDVLSVNEAKREVSKREVSYHDIDTIAKAMNMNYYAFGAGYDQSEGNLLMSAHPIQHSDNYRINDRSVDGGFPRSIVGVKIDGGSVVNSIYCLHLDHISERRRIQQLDLMFSEYKSLKDDVSQKLPHLLIGDFNSLSRNDYSEEYLNQMTSIRKKNNWELPHFNVIDEYMKEKGYVDCWKSKHPDLRDDTASTCEFGTRIDYVFASNIHDDWHLDTCDIFSSNNITDHNGIVCIWTKNV